MDSIIIEAFDSLILLGKALNGTTIPEGAAQVFASCRLGRVAEDGTFVYGGPDPAEW